ncbi:hypothetical protein KDA_34680 [Dictyobacter alpinus]|uniref:Uncharacterized protein n=1 Tax=Dictyobacter alpinus TaxID=2014873 RepID=A0A402B9D9_9CHLR|nr:hypothetical protein KDA_34680 [Dictyobacter alpinus]
MMMVVMAMMEEMGTSTTSIQVYSAARAKGAYDLGKFLIIELDAGYFCIHFGVLLNCIVHE